MRTLKEREIQTSNPFGGQPRTDSYRIGSVTEGTFEHLSKTCEQVVVEWTGRKVLFGEEPRPVTGCSLLSIGTCFLDRYAIGRPVLVAGVRDAKITRVAWNR